MTAKQIVKQAVHVMHSSRETGNTSRYSLAREIFKRYWRQRNSPKLIPVNS